MWPTQKPRVAPENRPSVMSATGLAQPGADDRAGDAEHLAHARPAARPLVADDDDVAGLDGLALDGVERRLLAVEHARRTAVRQRARCPEIFITAPSGARLPRRMTRPPLGLSGWPSGRTTSCPRVSTRVAPLPAPSVRPVTVGAEPSIAFASSSRLRDERAAAGAVQIGRDEAPGRLEVDVERRARADAIEVGELERQPASRAIAIRCSTALVEPPVAATDAIAFSSAVRVMMSRGRTPLRTRLHDALAGGAADVGLLRVGRRHAAAAERRDAEELAGDRHRVGGELPAAGARAGTAPGLRARAELGVAHRAGGVRADRLEDVLDRDRRAVERARARSSRRRAARRAC